MNKAAKKKPCAKECGSVGGVPGEKKVNAPKLTFKASEYLRLRIQHPEWTKERCKNEAGYSKNTDSRYADNQISRAISQMPDMAERIKMAQDESGFHVNDNLKVLARIRDRQEKLDPKAAIAAIKTGASITGETAPDRIDIGVSGDEAILAKIFG